MRPLLIFVGVPASARGCLADIRWRACLADLEDVDERGRCVAGLRVKKYVFIRS